MLVKVRKASQCRRPPSAVRVTWGGQSKELHSESLSKSLEKDHTSLHAKGSSNHEKRVLYVVPLQVQCIEGSAKTATVRMVILASNAALRLLLGRSELLACTMLFFQHTVKNIPYKHIGYTHIYNIYIYNVYMDIHCIVFLMV